jgi:hypothetical protein
MILDASYTLKGKLGGAADPAPTAVCWYEDVDQNGKVVGGMTPVEFNGATAVTLAAAPSDVTKRHIKGINVYNNDNASATVTLYVTDGTTDYELCVIALATLEHLTWTPETGWSNHDADGTKKVN